MATERLSMRKTKEILRQKWALGRSHREIAASLGVSVGVVGKVSSRALSAKLDWATTQPLDEDALEERLFGRAPEPGASRAMPDCAYLHAERRRPGVTLELLHLEYLEKQPDGYRYTQFCDYYRRWLSRRGLAMRHVHHGGDKLFVDYAGKKPHIVDATTGEMIEVELFVAVLGASNFTYAEATRTQQGRDWIASHVRAFEFFGGVTNAVVCDQLKTGVALACRYEPGIQRTYEEMAEHYGTTVLPARPARPRDKAKVEVAVQIVERWILARLRHHTFFSLEEINVRMRELLDEINDRRMKRYGASRRELFERLDRPALRALAAEPFRYGEWRHATVSIDYHVEVEHHLYSVPHALVHEKVDARVTSTTVEIFHRNARVASHAKSSQRGRHTTCPEHMPKAHQKHLEWTPSRMVRWGSTIGPSTAMLVDAILRERRHPEQGYRSCLGILRLSKVYGEARLEAACARAVAVRARSYKHVASILKHGLDRLPALAPATPMQVTLEEHENIRGEKYFN